MDWAVRAMRLVFKLLDRHISRTPHCLGFGANRASSCLGWKCPGSIDQSVFHIDWAVRAKHHVFKVWIHHISRMPNCLGFGGFSWFSFYALGKTDSIANLSLWRFLTIPTS